MKRIKVMAVFGTRPEAIKMAPVVMELAKYPQFIQPVIAVTAQHREMLDQVLALFKITPDYDLDIMAQGQNLFDITQRAMQGLHQVMEQEQPDLVLVHGDTTTTFAGALTAFYHQIPVGHVEAGLRTGNKYSPYPEEMNRKLTGAITDFHFAPTVSSRANLNREGVDGTKIYVTGNTVIDALLATLQQSYHFTDPGLAKVRFADSRVILVTTHRRENLGEPMRHVYQALKSIVELYPDVEVVFPVHKNPLVRNIVNQELGNLDRVHLIDPLEYQPFVNVMARSYLILTDSGGIQEEAPALGKPVLVLRDTTERPEAIEAGTVKLIGTSRQNVFEHACMLLNDKIEYESMANACNPYGDGKAAARIIAAILNRFGCINDSPQDFVCSKM